MTSLISIIIPTYNRAHLIVETLNSILAQTYTSWECIVVDDGSTDDNEKIIQEYIIRDSRFQFHKRPESKIKGANSCRNFGFELSKGEYIKWFDSDDVMLPNLLEKQILSFNNDVNVSVCKLAYYDFDKGISIKENRIFSTYLIEDYLRGSVGFYISGPLWKKSFLNSQEELFDEKISNLDDWDFNLRMLYQAPKIAYLDEVLIKYRVHENSLSKEIGKLNFEEIKFEFHARQKHLKLIKQNKKVNFKVIENSNIAQYKFILREALVANNDKKYYFLKHLLIKQLESHNIKGVFKTLIGFFIYSFFKKGYKIL